MTRASDEQHRQRRITRTAAPPVTQRALAGPAGTGNAAPDIVCGKIVAINLEAQEAHVAPINADADPTDANVWSDAANFGDPVCAWTQGLSAAAVNNPAICIRVATDRYWMVFHPNLIGVDYSRFCVPDGQLSPEGTINCDPLTKPGICGTTYACCKFDGTCEDLNKADCEAADGVYYGPESPSLTDGLTCADLAGAEITCEPLGACCLPPFGGSGTCIHTTPEACDDLKGMFHAGQACDEVTCQ